MDILKNITELVENGEIEIEKATGIDKFIISEVHRDEKQLKIETENEVEASIYSVFLSVTASFLVAQRKSGQPDVMPFSSILRFGFAPNSTGAVAFS